MLAPKNLLIFTLVASCRALKLLEPFHQDLYDFVPDHCEIKTVNESLIHFQEKSCFKLSRLDLRANASFYYHQDILSDDMGQVVGYQFRSNEFRKGPLEFMLGFCTMLNTRQFGIPDLLAMSNWKCPIKKGKLYYAYNIAPNARNMPPMLPEGKWRIDLNFWYMNKYLMVVIQWYTDIQYDILKGPAKP